MQLTYRAFLLYVLVKYNCYGAVNIAIELGICSRSSPIVGKGERKMLKINGKIVVALLVSVMLISPTFIKKNFAQGTAIYVDPLSSTVQVCTQFTVDIDVIDVQNLWAFEFWLSYDTRLLDALSVNLGPFLNTPNHIVHQEINDPQGWLMLAASSDQGVPGVNGKGTLANVTFHCTGAGTTTLHLYYDSLWDPGMNLIPHVAIDGYVTQQLPWYVKPSYPDYAPAGMPDFDQKQDNWLYPMSGWTWCGAVSVANSLWWLDSEFESLLFPGAVPPPAISDHFNLVTTYSPNWDDHDVKNVGPLVTNLAFLMDTDGIRTGIVHSGTFFKDMQVGISQYIAQQGLNPYGDCDGDGDVDYNDMIIFNKSYNSRPGDPNWNMACDFDRNNVVDFLDLTTSINNYGTVGKFYEHTTEFPVFSYIENETYACEDVVLLLEFWQWNNVTMTWTRYNGIGYDLPGGLGGHYVTVAGVNSTTSELLISDPYWDAFEARSTPGDSPIPHPYPHTSDVHNDTQFVSHDDYPAVVAALSPYTGPVLELPTYLLAEKIDPSWHTFIRAAVVTSPLTIVPANVETTKDNCMPKVTVGKGSTTNVSATIINQGLVPQDFTVTVYANSTALGSTTVKALAAGAQITVMVATWNTSTWAYGQYFLTATTNVSYPDIIYPSFTSAVPVWVVIPGDINGDGTVDLSDAILLSNSFLTGPGDLDWNPNADIVEDGTVDLSDAIVLSSYFLEVRVYDP
jgi:hypothetical protein